uniref:Polycystic kidney disease 1a n=1 Tax=Esox lucius TaxID=8010 RepID=A0A3P8Y0M3_ESOLU
ALYVNGVSGSLGTTASTHHHFTKGNYALNIKTSKLQILYVLFSPKCFDMLLELILHFLIFNISSPEGAFQISVWAFNEFYNSTAVERLFYLSNESIQEIGLLFSLPAVTVHTERRAYPTNTDISFLALTEEPDPVEFTWHFGDSRPVRTTSRFVRKRYNTPDRYSVVVLASNGPSSVTSQAHPVLVQRAVHANRLLLQPSVLLNHAANFTCRTNAGTDLSYAWSFGDGTSRTGGSMEQHVFHRTGEFTVEVTVSNLVSSASLTAQMFVVDRPCEPPPVKNMGPLKIQVRRYEMVRLGVTYEGEVRCDVSRGLEYRWSLYSSAGLPVHLGPVHAGRQSITLPSHFLHYGVYTAVARVQVVGQVVYSNYSVRVEVVPSPPVSDIQGGSNVFISRGNGSVITLNGQQSYDPDYPMNQLSFSWTCKPISALDSSCFDQYVPTLFSAVVFPVGFLKQDFDQFRFSLTVRSGERTSSADTFITITPLTIMTSVSHCPGDSVNWDQSFSVRAVCENCGPVSRTVRFAWTLYLVKSSRQVETGVPFCHSVDLSAPSNIIGVPPLTPPPSLTSPRPRRTSHASRVTSSNTVGGTSVPGSLVTQSPSVSANHPARSSPEPVSDPVGFVSSAPEPGKQVTTLKEHISICKSLFSLDSVCVCVCVCPSVCVSSGVDGGSYGSSGGDSAPAIPESGEDEESNLMDSSPSLVVLDPTLLDLPRELVQRELFESYTYTGISSALIMFKPFTLRAGSKYMLEVTANSHDAVVGQTQLFLSTSPTPRGMTCQVQPSSGVELHTHFSIFCTSGREDLLYEFSFSIGHRTPMILYQGRDFQYYFNLPSGDPDDGYKVTIYTEVRNRFGTATRPCPVTVTVLPSFSRNSSHCNPNTELFESGLRNLSALVQLGNTGEIRNYVHLLSIVLNRLTQDPVTDTQTHTHTRTALIHVVCHLEAAAPADGLVRDKASVDDVIPARPTDDLVRDKASVDDVTPARPTDDLVRDKASVDDVTLARPTDDLVRDKASVDDVTPARPTDDLVRDKPTDHVKWARHYNVTTSVMDLQMTQHSRGQTTVIRSGSATVHLPECLDLVLYGQKGRETADRPQSLCVFCQLTTFTHNPYFWAKTAVQLTGPVIDLTLYNCSTRREVPVRSLSQPINTVFPKTPTNLSSVYEFTLLQSQVNYHSFNITQQALQEAIQVSVEFMWPPNNTFPIMLLFRMFEKPTPSLFHIQSIYRWDRNTHHISLPPSYLSGSSHLCLTLPHLTTISLSPTSLSCLSWDHQQGWMHEGCTPGLGLTSHSGVSCSCSHLRPLTVVQQQIQIAHEDSEDLIQFVSLVSDATVVCVCVVCVCLYAVGTTMCKRADIISEKNQEVHYLSDNCWSDTHLYCVTIHTGLRSSTSMSAQVYIVLYGEDGASLTRQLHVPECPLFRRNSRDTFILSSADCLGPLWGVRLWHDSTGSSPSWYLRQVEVCEVKDNGRSWLFLGRCWLAVDEGDGRVERRLRVRQQGPGFTELLCLKLSEYMSDFHLWLSVYGGPAPSAFTRTQRLSVCVLLCLGYMCVNVLILSGFEDKRTSELGLVDVSVVSLTTGLLSALTVLPIATAVSLLFRQRKVGVKRSAVKQETVRLQGIYSLEGCVFGVCMCVRFSSTKTLLWIHSLFISLISCVFLLQPAMVLKARQRARYLRLIGPPTPGELRRTAGRRMRETLIHKTLRCVCVLCVLMLFLLLCMTYGSFPADHCRLTRTIQTHPSNPFLSVQTHEEFWNWTLLSLVDSLPWRPWNNNTQETGKVGIGLCVCVTTSSLMNYHESTTTETALLMSSCPIHSRSECVSRLEFLRSTGWLGRRTIATATHFTLYSPSSNQLASVTLLAERSLGGALHTSVHVESARLYHTPTAWFYFSMVSQVAPRQHTCLLCPPKPKKLYTFSTFPRLTSGQSPPPQHTRTLCGVLLLLLAVQSVCLMGVNRATTASLTLLKLTFSRLIWPMLIDVCLCPQTFYLQEFESLLDELLFRLNSLSNNQQNTLPPKDIFNRVHSPFLCPTLSPSSLASQVRVPRYYLHIYSLNHPTLNSLSCSRNQFEMIRAL